MSLLILFLITKLLSPLLLRENLFTIMISATLNLGHKLFKIYSYIFPLRLRNTLKEIDTNYITVDA